MALLYGMGETGSPIPVKVNPDGSIQVAGGGGGGGGSSTQRTPTATALTGAGTVALGATSVSFYNSGAADATVLGRPLPPGASWPIMATGSDTLAAITYDFTGTTGTVTVLR